MDDHRGVLVVGELGQSRLATVTRELLGAGRRLADELGEPLGLLLIGDAVSGCDTEASALGVDTLYVAEGPHLAAYNGDVYMEIAGTVAGETAAAVILMGHTTAGREMGPRLAARLGGSLFTDCVDLALDAARWLVATRPVYGGNAMAGFVSKTLPQIATVRPKAMPETAACTGKNMSTVAVSTDSTLSRIELSEVVVEEAAGPRIEDAGVVVAVGAGVRQEDFGLVCDLAQVLGGAVGGTRLPYEEGWIPASSQIGQTGKMITPDLYVAVGISGAPQHMAGCTGAKRIVAINNDPEAHIFKMADYGIVADYKEALPVLIEKIREMTGA